MREQMPETVETVRERERERELYFREIAFICAVNKNIIIYRKINYTQKERKRRKRLKLLSDSLSFL